MVSVAPISDNKTAVFKLIEYIKNKCDCASTSGASYRHIFHYHLVDDEFECEVPVVITHRRKGKKVWRDFEPYVTAVVLEYTKRNLHILENLYLLINFQLKETHFSSFEGVVQYLSIYMDKYYAIPEINFTKDICPKLLKMRKELSILSETRC